MLNQYDQYDDQHGELRTHFSEALSNRYEKLPMGEGRNRKVAHSQGQPQQQIELVSTDHHSAQRQWRKTISYQLQSP